MNTGPLGSGWYYSKLGGPPGEQVGPVSWEELVSLARSGLVASDDLIRSEQRAEWHPAGHLPGLFSPAAPSVLPSVPPSVPPSYAYPPPAPPVAAAAAPAPAGRSRLLLWLIPVIVVVLIGAGLGAYFGIWYGAGSSVTSALEELAFFQREGDILLEPVGSAGPGSFTGEEFVTAAPTTSLSIPNPAVTLPPITATPTSGAQSSTSSGVTQSTTTPTVAAQPVVLASYPGDTPALYGGSKSKLIADKEQELAYLERNPLKARAFCEALNSDPTLRWSGGTTVSPSQLRDYFAELTPLLLTRDTRVTNYGYRNGHPTPRQSVLQAGQLVLVDRYGVPRKRCECGNPLTPPIASRRPPTYTGPRWPTFNPQTVIIIQQTTVVINNFTVININTGETFGRPPGTNGGSDGPPPSMGENSSTPGSTGSTGSMGMNWGTGEIPTTTGTAPPTTAPPTTASTVPPSTTPTTQIDRLAIENYIVSSNNIDRVEGNKLEMWHGGDTAELKGPITVDAYYWHIDVPYERSETIDIPDGQTHTWTVDEYSTTHPGDCNIRLTVLSWNGVETQPVPLPDPTPQ
ncbi:MAG: DUF4339 domain-containing protein [Actinobacteria bacterium]|nr:DUF4339 domain-containing protein [Actinomycetota bacterium]